MNKIALSLTAAVLAVSGSAFAADAAVNANTNVGVDTSALKSQAKASKDAMNAQAGATKGAAIYSLLEYLESARDQALPAWVARLRQEAAASYFDLPAYMQGGLISGGYWSLLRGPEMVALLKRVLAARITDYNVEQNWNGALRRLHEVAPAAHPGPGAPVVGRWGRRRRTLAAAPVVNGGSRCPWWLFWQW